jgi:hypothetical protein
MHDVAFCTRLCGLLAAAGAPVTRALHVWDGSVPGAKPAPVALAGHAATSLDGTLPLPPAFGLFAGTSLVEAEPSKLDSRLLLHRSDSARNVLQSLPQPPRRSTSLATSGQRVKPQGAGQTGRASQPPHGALVDSVRSVLELQGMLVATNNSAVTSPADGAEQAAPNAFAISLFCVHPDFESRFPDFLAAAFRALPDCDYAILTQPHMAPDMPLLKRFEQVQPRLKSTLPQVMHICHRSAAVSPSLITCRIATPVDRLPILELVAPLPDGPAFMDAIIAAERISAAAKHRGGHGTAPALPPLVAVVAELGSALVGAFVLSTAGSSELAWEAVTHSFDLDGFIVPRLYLPLTGQRSPLPKPKPPKHEKPQRAEFAVLLHAAIDPSVECAAPQALLAAMRLLPNTHAVIYRQQPVSEAGLHSELPGVVLRHMTLVPPRRLPALSPAQQSARAEQRMAGAEAADRASWSALAGGEGVPGIDSIQVRLWNGLVVPVPACLVNHA